VKILVTGASGFAGRWLVRELLAAGHETVSLPPSSELDITDSIAIEAIVKSAEPDAIAHLAGLSYGPDARRNPERAFAVNEGGTKSVMSAASAMAKPTPVMVVSSAEVYGDPAQADLPLRESAPLHAGQPYGLSKLAAERVARESASAGGPSVVIARPFNHTGPGQRSEFVVPALAGRVLVARQKGDQSIRAGNVDVRRDFSDVRDVVRAYRLILESFTRSGPDTGPRIYNIASGRSVAIRDLAQRFAALAGIKIEISVDPSLVRATDPPEISGDASRIEADLGWRPSIPLDDTLKDVLDDLVKRGIPVTS
jgi:GDP-4-dehydro-6-deoxy-D-mannose reductase